MLTFIHLCIFISNPSFKWILFWYDYVHILMLLVDKYWNSLLLLWYILRVCIFQLCNLKAIHIFWGLGWLWKCTFILILFSVQYISHLCNTKSLVTKKLLWIILWVFSLIYICLSILFYILWFLQYESFLSYIFVLVYFIMHSMITAVKF